MKNLALVLFAFVTAAYLSSCQFHTAISYRVDISKAYILQDGYILSCNKDHFSYGDVLIVGTYTPETWGESFYYGYLKGIKSDQKVKIINTKIKFIETGDTLTLKEIRKDREYVYFAADLANIIDENKQLQLTVFLKQNNDANIIEKTFLLNRHKQTNSTGTLPHS